MLPTPRALMLGPRTRSRLQWSPRQCLTSTTPTPTTSAPPAKLLVLGALSQKATPAALPAAALAVRPHLRLLLLRRQRVLQGQRRLRRRRREFRSLRRRLPQHYRYHQRPQQRMHTHSSLCRPRTRSHRSRFASCSGSTKLSGPLGTCAVRSSGSSCGRAHRGRRRGRRRRGGNGSANAPQTMGGW